MDWGNVTTEDLIDALREVDWSSPARPLNEFFSKFTVPKSNAKWNSRLKCNFYYFGICLWEIYCCDIPYPDLSFSEVTSVVVRQNLRPEIPRCCPSALANVMKRCWDANPNKRPEMDEVVSMLEAIDTSKGGGMIPVDQAQGCLCFRKAQGP